jgi:diadenosine tetraphosphate (Ap4A) HIT family hydrolase
MNEEKSPFTAIISGDAEGKIIAQDDERQLAIIECLEPEAAVHWLAVPFEYGQGTEELKKANSSRFLELVDYAVVQTKALAAEYPILSKGFTIKFHVGAFETIPHAKLHILSIE